HDSATTPRYASTSSRDSRSAAFVRRMRISHPSPYGSSLTVSGASATRGFTASTSPDSGETRSETAFTDSTSPYEPPCSTVDPTCGGSKCTSSPSESAAYQVIPSTASSPSIRAQSCSALYSSSSGYDSLAGTSLLSLVDRLRHHLRAPRSPAKVHRQLRPGCARLRRNVAETDADAEHRREGPGGHLAPALERHALPWDARVGHRERDQALLGAVLLHVAQRVRADEVGVERADPRKAARDRVPLRTDVVAVQRVAHLESKRVAGAEPARRDAAREDRVPQTRRVVDHARELDTLLAGVAGAVHHH